ncbi:MAG: protein-glutamate O-methyltransferase CheR [Deltaproteobacteria bacterium]|nr:protein-glutamate O-methyltransferase CheR [Deltaproteobacteria bacterium]
MHDLSPSQFQTITDLMFRQTGIQLSKEKQMLVKGRLVGRLHHLGLRTFEEYFKYLSSNLSEVHFVVGAVTTHYTSFFREAHHFRQLVTEIVPRQQKKTRSRSLRVWSAGCSTGEEAYTVAMVLDDALGVKCRLEVVGTDVSKASVQKAKNGVYSASEVRGIPRGHRQTYLQSGTGGNRGTFRVAPQLRAMVKFVEHNLLEVLNNNGDFDIIFIRNVLIYFGEDQVQKILSLLIRRLTIGGVLFVGHSEVLAHPLLRRMGRNAYERVQA